MWLKKRWFWSGSDANKNNFGYRQNWWMKLASEAGPNFELASTVLDCLVQSFLLPTMAFEKLRMAVFLLFFLSGNVQKKNLQVCHGNGTTFLPKCCLHLWRKNKIK
jgi:hypothetical protein